MATRQQIIEEARSWKGTPWQHQGRLKGVAADCAGLVIGTGQACGVVVGNSWALSTGYGMQPDTIKMKAALDELFIRIRKDEMKAGDIPWLRAGAKAQHLGIVAEDGAGRRTLIHATNFKRIEELPMEAAVNDRIVAVYRFKGLED